MSNRFAAQALSIYQHPGPFTTVYLPARSDRPDADELYLRGWDKLERTLSDRGSPASDLKVIDRIVQQGHTGGSSIAVIAHHGSILHAQMTHIQVTRRAGYFGWLPRLAPLLTWHQSQVRHLLVNVGMNSADLLLVCQGHHVEDHNPSYASEAIFRPGTGSWPRRRNSYGQTEEELVVNLAGQIIAASTSDSPHIIHVAGDKDIVRKLIARLPPFIQLKLRISEQELPSNEEILARHSYLYLSMHTAGIISRLSAKLDAGNGARQGADDVINSLNKGEVETLVVGVDGGDRRQAWFGTTPVPVALNEGNARRAGLHARHSAWLAEVAIRSAIGTGAAVWFVPRSDPEVLDNGIGALIRHPPGS